MVEGACRVVVAHGGGDGVELVEGGPRLEAGGGVGQRLELLVGGHDVGVGVAFADAALGIDFIDGEETGAVEVQVGGEDLLGEGVDAFSVTAGDVAVSEVLADDRAVLALDEGVVVAAAGSGLGELVDVEGLQPGGDFVVDELRTVVGVESADVEGERPEQGFEDGGETGRVDALDRADELELGDLVDEVEVVEALDAVEVSLVDGIDPQVAGLSEGLGPAPLADGDVHGAGRRGHRPAPALIAGRVAQVVEVSVGDGGEALEAAVAEQLQGPDAELAGGRTGEGAVEGIDFGEQPDVGLGVAAWEGVPEAAAVGDGSCGPVLVQQARDLRAREAGHLVRKRRIRPLSAFPRRE